MAQAAQTTDDAGKSEDAADLVPAVFSPSSMAKGLPEREWLSVGSIAQEIDDLTKQFATTIPVTIVDRTTDIIPDATFVGSGVLVDQRIHLIREGLGDRGTVVRTLWHEVLRYL